MQRRNRGVTARSGNGVPIEVISKVLGHANIQTTLIYANYSNRVIDREMEKFKINVPTG